jgi:hypothetical protein
VVQPVVVFGHAAIANLAVAAQQPGDGAFDQRSMSPSLCHWEFRTLKRAARRAVSCVRIFRLVPEEVVQCIFSRAAATGVLKIATQPRLG